MPEPRSLDPGSPIEAAGEDAEVWNRSQRMSWISLTAVGTLAIGVPAAIGMWSIAGIGVAAGLVFLLVDRLAGDRQILARNGTQLSIFATFAVTAYATFAVGVSSVITVYVSTLILLATAHVLGARAALAWALPCLALTLAAVFLPPPVAAPVGAVTTAAVRIAVLLTVLGFAASFRMHQDRQASALEDLALTDALTGLANRRQLDRALQAALDRAQRFGRQCAVVFIDLDGMKTVNDRLGHAAGDVFLRDVAQRIRRCTRRVDTVARLGGDEFVVVLSEVADREGIARFVGQLIERVSEPLELEGHTLRPSLSLGAAVHPGASDSGKELLYLADAAMYAAKQSGGGGCCLHDADGQHALV